MKYEIYIQESKKSQKFCKKAIAEYEKRLSRYCKISCKFIKKEKEWESLLVKDTGMKKFIVQPGKAELTSEKLSEQIKNWEGSGIKGIMFLVPEWSEEILAESADVGMVVIASHGCSGLADFLKPHVSQDIVKLAKCPVLVVK